MRDYQREVLFGDEGLDSFATEREMEELQERRVARLRRPTFDVPEPEEEEEEQYEPRPYSGEYTNAPKYKVFKNTKGEILGYTEDGFELDSEGNPKKTILYDHNDWERLTPRADADEESDYTTRTDREKVADWLHAGSGPSEEPFPGVRKLVGVAGEVAGEKLGEAKEKAKEKLGDVAEYIGDTIEHYDDRRLLSYGVSPDLLSTYRAWQEKYENLREAGDVEGAKQAYREMRAVKYQIDSQVERYQHVQSERRAEKAALKRREQGISTGPGGRTSGRSSRTGGRTSGMSDRGLENRLMPKKNPANVSLFPERRRGSNLTVDVRRNQNVDLSVRGNPGAISPVVRRSGAVAGGVPPLSGGVSPLVHRRTQYEPVLHRPRYEPPRIGQSFPAPIPRQARAPVPQSTTPRFQFPTVSAAGFFGGVIGGNVVNNIERNFALPNRHGTTTPRRFKRRHETSPVKSTSQIVNNINSLVGVSHEKRRGARVTVGTPTVNLPVIDPSRFGNAVTPKKMKKRGSATPKKRGSNINANLADLAGVTIRRFRK
jgi:hypothetical protein